ncbi:homoserine dehydrogenase [bacterium M21]|nr:homoserine dehydrogenase [bacterium M21]
MAKELKIGLLGFGTVGAGVVKHLQNNGELIGARCGVRPVIGKIADLDITTDRGVTVDPTLLTTDAESVINDPDIDVIVELVGGTGVALKFAIQALEAGKPVVTANKAMLAKCGDELFAAAAKGNADIYYEASVAGGIPIIKALREGLSGNHIKSIYGILNGTCNYILTRMEREGIDFDSVLAEAQALGYAEADPALDVDGGDTAHKTTILASLAYGTWFGMDDIHMEGIRGLNVIDITNADKLGYRVKLLGIIKFEGDDVQMRVHPTLLPKTAQLAGVDGVFNSVFVDGDVVGPTMFYGAGAGQDATASAVIGDIVDVCLNLKYEIPQRIPAFRAHESYKDKLMPMSEIISRYYLRLALVDKPGVLASITTILGNHNISIASASQIENGEEEEAASVVFLTHEAKEADLQAALEEIKQLDVVQAEPIMLRIETI